MSDCSLKLHSIVVATIVATLVIELFAPGTAYARRRQWRRCCSAADSGESCARIQIRASNEQAVRKLIDELASPNKPPRIISGRVGDPDRLDVPPGYDRGAQARIYASIEKLGRFGVDAIGPLIDHLQDDRYSISDESDDYWRNMSVGHVCFEVLRGYLEVYHDKISYDNAGEYWAMSYCLELSFDDPQHAVQFGKRWWASRKYKSLVQLQIEAAEWAMDRPVSRSSEDPEREQRKRENLADFLDNLRRSREPIPWEAGSLFYGQLTE